MKQAELILSLRKISRIINLDSKRIQKLCGLSIPQLLSLQYLERQEDYQSTQLDLRKHLELNSSTVTGIVSRLISKGLMAKLPAKGDKRATWLCLTAAGLKATENAPLLFQNKLISKLNQIPNHKSEAIEKGLKELAELLEEFPAELEA